MSMYGDNTIKQDVLDALEGCQYGSKYDEELREYVDIQRPFAEVLVAALQVLGDKADDIRLEHRRYYNVDANN